jgi:hypothetical protein
MQFDSITRVGFTLPGLAQSPVIFSDNASGAVLDFLSTAAGDGGVSNKDPLVE